MAFDEFVVWSWNIQLCFGKVWYNTKKQGVVWKCICTCALSQWKMVEELSCVLCEFILLKYEERQYSLNLHHVFLHFM